MTALPCRGISPALSRRMLSLAGCAALASTLGGCVDLAPKYRHAHYLLPDNWKGDGLVQYGTPQDGAARGDWWKVFRDPTLDELEERASHLNPNLQADAEAFTQPVTSWPKHRPTFTHRLPAGRGHRRTRHPVTGCGVVPGRRGRSTCHRSSIAPQHAGNPISGPPSVTASACSSVLHRRRRPILRWPG